MNFNKIYRQLSEEFDSIDFSIESMSEDSIRISANANLNGIDDDILINVVVFDSGTSHIYFIFDSIARTLKNYELINDFNNVSPFLKAYIARKDGGDFLEIHGCDFNSQQEDDIVNSIMFCLTELASDGILDALAPICDETR